MGKKTRNENGEGSIRAIRDENGKVIKYECMIQSQYVNPETLKPKRIKVTGSTQSEAREKAKERLRIFEKGIEHQKNVQFNITLGEYTKDSVKERKVKKGTMKDYYYKLNKHFYPSRLAKLQFNQLTFTDFEEFYIEVYKVSKVAAKNIRFVLNKVLDEAISDGLIKENYSRQFEFEREFEDEIKKTREYTDREMDKKCLTDEELMILYDFYQKYKYTRKYPAVYILMLETSIRIGELCGLRIYDFDEENRLLHINSQIQHQLNFDDSIRCKNDSSKMKKVTLYETVLKERNSDTNKNKDYYEKVIYLHDLAFEACQILKAKALSQYHNGKNDDEFLVPNQNGGPMDSNTFRVSYHDDMERMGIYTPKLFGPHKAFRHSGITFANARCDTSNLLANLQKSGHSSLRMEEHYTHRDSIDIMKLVATPYQVLLKQKKEENTVTISKDEYNELLEFVRKFKELQQA